MLINRWTKKEIITIQYFQCDNKYNEDENWKIFISKKSCDFFPKTLPFYSYEFEFYVYKSMYASCILWQEYL